MLDIFNFSRAESGSYTNVLATKWQKSRILDPSLGKFDDVEDIISKKVELLNAVDVLRYWVDK